MRSFLGLIASLSFAGTAVAQETATPQTEAQISSIINTYIPDNTAQFVTPAALRAVLHTMNASYVVDATLNVLPTLSSCGTGSSVVAGSTSNSGWVNFGSGTTSCVVAFGAGSFQSYAFCVVQALAAGTPYLTSLSKTGFTIAGGVASASYTYICAGQ